MADPLVQLEKQHVWHPFTQMQAWEAADPLFIESGEGVFVKDRDGRSYYDANSSLWVNVHGHRHPVIDRAIRNQLDRIAHTTMLGLTHPLAAELAAQLTGIVPTGLTRVFYSDSGSEAVEIALKLAFQYWRNRGQAGRKRFVALRNGYHGDTIGAVSVGGISLFHGLFHDLLFDVDFAPCPAETKGLDEALEGVEALLRQATVAAVILEPLIQAAGGMLLEPPGFLAGVRELCTRFGVLLIVDEVATGFGRTGKMFACEHENVSPDLMCLAKGITGGYLPLAATLATDEVYAAFLGDSALHKTFYHGHSYTGNPLACAAALGSLEVFRNENTIAGLAAKIACVQSELTAIAGLRHVGCVRQCGLMAGIELAARNAPLERYPAALSMGADVCRRARSLGLITRPLGDVVVFLPPLCSSIDDLRAMLAIVGQAIHEETECGESGQSA